MPAPSRLPRFACLYTIASLLLITSAACRHRQQPARPTSQPTPVPIGVHRTSHDGIELTVELPPSTRWSAHTIIQLTNNSTTPIHIPRHPTSLVHDYHLKLRDAAGADVPTRMMLKLPQSTQPTSRLTLQPNETHEEGLQLGMLFALRPGEQYTLGVTVPVQIQNQSNPTFLTIENAHFTVTAE